MGSVRRGSLLTSLKLGVAFVAVIALSIGAASPAAAATARYGPFASTSPDSGTCGPDWANDSFQRVFKVNTTPTAPGTYRVREDFNRGSFVTTGPLSPGACESGTNNGGTVLPGVNGRMGGHFIIIVTGGAYNAAAVCTAANCGTTAGFIATVFGPAATSNVTTFIFRYVTHCNGKWVNASADKGGNRGDITGAPHSCGGGHGDDGDQDNDDDNHWNNDDGD